MDRKTFVLPLLALLILLECVPLVSAHNAPFPSSYDPTHLVMDTVLEPETLDPAWANDIGSHEVIMNVYETLLFFDRNYKNGPYAAGKADQFVPRLATSWTEQVIQETSPEGVTWVRRWTFTIRTNVKFHDGTYMTPEDIEYSFERLLVQDRTGGPSWMLFEPLLGPYRPLSDSDPSFGHKIDHAIESDATSVWFNLHLAYPSTTFKQILSHTCGSVLKKAWAVAKGDFDGNWDRPWAQIWDIWHDPVVSFIEGDMMGTGPYEFSYWMQNQAWSIVKFDHYWDGWPAWKDEARTERIVDFISRVTWNLMTSWMTRRARFQVGDSDLSYIDRAYRDEILGTDMIRCYFDWESSPGGDVSGSKPQSSTDASNSEITYESPLLGLDAFFFNFGVSTISPYLGPGFDMNAPFRFGEDRIPIDLFSDINVRIGFAYAFPYTVWVGSAYKNEAELPSDPIIKGLPYDNPNQERYDYNGILAAYHLQLAWGGLDSNSDGDFDDYGEHVGALWNNGMTFTIVYPEGDDGLESAADVLAVSVNGLHQQNKFHISIQGAQWGSSFLPQMCNGQIPLFMIDYQGSVFDPHGFVHPFMHSSGVFARSQHYNNPAADSLIEQGILTPDGPQRQQIYYDLQAIYHDDVPSVTLVQPVGRQFERDWMRGWYYNPLYQGQYVYHRWKAKTHFGDANNDGAVNIFDSAYVSAHWTKPDPGSSLGQLGYNPAADLSGGVGGIPGGGSGPVVGIPDGRVGIVDQALISSYWDGPPQGPSHP